MEKLEFEGIISPEGEKLLAEILDDLIVSKNKLVEMFDGKFLKIAISTLDNNFLDKIPADWKSPVNPIVEAAIQQDWHLVIEKAIDFADQKIDIPGVDDLSEQLIFNSIAELAVGLLTLKANKELNIAPE